MRKARANDCSTSKSYLRFAYCAAILTLSGCGLPQWARHGFKVGPEYCRPLAPVASNWIDYTDARVVAEPPQLVDWWTTFNDPSLNELTGAAYRQNLTLREAGARILEARNRRRVAAGNVFPQLQEAAGGYGRNKIPETIANAPPELWYSQWDAGFNATWELDFWGRYRRAVAAADAELDASIEDYDDVLVLLLAEVASTYADLRTFQQRVEYARQNVISQEQSLQITQDKFRNGVATERDVQQAITVLEQTRALIPLYETGARLANNQLCVLLGFPPQDLTPMVGKAPIPSARPEVAVGIPADLVRRRPDVRRAERELAAQSERIGVAVSDLYPHIGLNGTIGVAAADFDNLFDGQRSMFGGIGPSFRWDVLNYGRIAGNIGVQDARFQQLAWNYQQRVLIAGREAEDAIVTYLRGQERVRSLALSADAAKRTREITFEQYRQGVVEFTAVFLAESEQATRQDELAEAQGATARGLIDLYRSLGGGWEIRLAPGPRTTSVPPAAAHQDHVPPQAAQTGGESTRVVLRPANAPSQVMWAEK